MPDPNSKRIGTVKVSPQRIARSRMEEAKEPKRHIKQIGLGIAKHGPTEEASSHWAPLKNVSEHHIMNQ